MNFYSINKSNSFNEVATLNVALAVMKAAAAADKASQTEYTFGFYFDAKLTRTGDKTNISNNNIDEVASSLLANNSILISSGSSLTLAQAKDEDKGNTNIKGSIISNDGDITITSKGDTNITAAKSTSSSSMKSEGFTQTVTLGGSANSSVQQVMESMMAQISLRSSKSNADNTQYNNTILSAENGNLNINTFDDATIKGSDLIAEKIILNTGNNLDIESLQNVDHSKSKSTSVGAGGGQNSVSLSYNASRSKFDREWVDDQTSVIGTNSVIINTNNNTNLTGALVANITNATKDDITKQGQAAKDAQKDWVDGGNLTLNTKSFTFQDIIDTEKQESSAIGINLNLRVNTAAVATNAANGIANAVDGGNRKTNNDTNVKDDKNNITQNQNYYPKGSLGLNLQDEGYEKEQQTKATIGQGNITTGSDLVLNFDTNPVSATYGNLLNKTGGTTLADNDPSLSVLNRDVTKTQEITKDTIIAALNVNTTIDLRLLTEDGRAEIKEEVKNLPINTLLSALNGVNATIAVVNGVVTGSKELYNGIGLILTPQQKQELDGLMVNGRTVEVLAKIEEQLGHEISQEARQKVIKFIDGQVKGNAFLASLTPEEKTELVQKDAYGIHFDGTDNNGERDVKIGEESNVFRLSKLFEGLQFYVTGVGSDYDKKEDPITAKDKYEQATGAGAETKEQEMMGKIAKEYQNALDNGKNQPFLVADVVGFSRGAATARNFANLLTNLGVTSGNQTFLMPEQIILRSVLPFDTVSSFGVSWNGFDFGKDFKTSTDAITIHPTAEDEKRLNFGLQSIKPSADSSLPSNWIEYAFPGAHSDIGGSYKEKDAALYVMNWMINQVNAKAGDTIYNTPSQDQMPSAELTNLMNSYLNARDSGNTSLAAQYKQTMYEKGYLHKSDDNTLPNISIGPRQIYYPNAQLESQFRLLPEDQTKQFINLLQNK